MLGERHFHPIALRPRGGLLVGQWPGHADQLEDSAVVVFARWYSERTLKLLVCCSGSGRSEAPLVVSPELARWR